MLHNEAAMSQEQERFGWVPLGKELRRYPKEASCRGNVSMAASTGWSYKTVMTCLQTRMSDRKSNNFDPFAPS